MSPNIASHRYETGRAEPTDARSTVRLNGLIDRRRAVLLRFRNST
jgi:hypothetical protein